MRYWSVKSWDKMQIPVPFTRAITIIGKPIYVPSDASDEVIQEKLTELQSVLDQLNVEGRAWSGRTSDT
jgi:lysophospholipid acyltransferase (LPLAT)-like uncharacterized protein